MVNLRKTDEVYVAQLLDFYDRVFTEIIESTTERVGRKLADRINYKSTLTGVTQTSESC